MRRVKLVVPVLLLAAGACDAPALTGPEASFSEAQTTLPAADSTFGTEETDGTQAAADGGIMMGSGT